MGVSSANCIGQFGTTAQAKGHNSAAGARLPSPSRGVRLLALPQKFKIFEAMEDGCPVNIRNAPSIKKHSRKAPVNSYSIYKKLPIFRSTVYM